MVFIFEMSSVSLFLIRFIRYLGFIGLILFPIDIGAAANEMGEADSTVLNVFWELIYWITFMLSWVYLPILMEYWASGRFSKKYETTKYQWTMFLYSREKIKESLWINVKSYIIIVLVAIVFVVWFTIVTKLYFFELEFEFVVIWPNYKVGSLVSATPTVWFSLWCSWDMVWVSYQ